ncbi:glycosyl hydrolase family 28-related protein [Melittangium boletus]|uniref:Uncharacterized protein n=1 Tax=Melittangium boletus DSM 14713 TaxID=1294270 RepID=A0A250I9L4_9BACT|nr:glycosyl hydrolase family 28-related protein [Melittangium boletus]ATB28435.1 hypothetical protein MEBOL_001882 [Melittangium boletus DSM 14713]
MTGKPRAAPVNPPFRGGLALGVLVLSLGSVVCTEPTDEPVPPPVDTPATPARGASLPWVEYQAEDGKTNARVIGPSRTRYDAAAIEAEAVGRKAVRLDKTGDYVAITSTKVANSIVVRLSIPDSATGGGIDATLGLYVNGQRVKSLPVTSRYSWVYQGEAIDTPNDPSKGEPHAFFDEVRALVDTLPAGTEVKLQKDAEDTAAFYVIDLIDLEQVAPPLEKPAGLISITDHGATPDDDVDDREAIQRAIDVAVGEKKKGIWIPRGTFLVNAERVNDQGEPIRGLSLKGIAFRGAGMWHSTLKGKEGTLYCWGEGGCHFADFSLLGEVDHRDDEEPANGFHGGMGQDSVVENVWVEHVKVGIWSGFNGYSNTTDGLVVKNSRFRNVYADGINFANGTRNSVVENSHFRNSGDDALAIWSFKNAGDPPGHDNVFRRNSVQMNWRANCFAIYGGYNNTIEDSTCEDVLTYSGILIDNEFDSHPFAPTTALKNISLIRAGGPMFGMTHGALRFYTRQGPVRHVLAENIDIVDPTYAGIQFQDNETRMEASLSDIVLKNVTVTGAGTYGIEAIDGARGEVSFEGVTVKDSARGALHAPGVPDSFFKRLPGNSGW